MRTLLGGIAVALLLTACGGESEQESPDFAEQLDQGIADGVSCSTLFVIRNEMPPDSTEVEDANEKLREIGCVSSGSERTEPAEVEGAAEAEHATTRQYASIVAGSQDFIDMVDEMSDCDWLGQGRLDWEPDLFVCHAGLLSMGWSASALSARLGNAVDESDADYIGPPPDEIARLVQDTRDAATALSASAEAAADKDCADSADGQCSELRSETWNDMNSMRRLLDTWGPYL